MVGGRGHGKSSGKSNPAIRISMPTIPKPTTISPQQGGTPTNIEASSQSISRTISKTPPATLNKSNLIGQDLFIQTNVPTGHTNTVVEGESNTSHTRTLVFLTFAGFISKSFKSDVEPNGINWKGVSNDVRNGYFGEFKKKFYWDVSIGENEVKTYWMVKAALNYTNFISKIKKGGVRPVYVPENVWERWMELWEVQSLLENRKLIRKIVVAAVKLLLGLTLASLYLSENIARNLLLKKAEIPRQVSCICMFIHMDMMENHLFVGVLEISMCKNRLLHSAIHRLWHPCLLLVM